MDRVLGIKAANVTSRKHHEYKGEKSKTEPIREYHRRTLLNGMNPKYGMWYVEGQDEKDG